VTTLYLYTTKYKTAIALLITYSVDIRILLVWKWRSVSVAGILGIRTSSGQQILYFSLVIRRSWKHISRLDRK